MFHLNIFEILTNEKDFLKTKGKRKFNYALFSKMPRIIFAHIFAHNFSTSPFQLENHK